MTEAKMQHILYNEIFAPLTNNYHVLFNNFTVYLEISLEDYSSNYSEFILKADLTFLNVVLYSWLNIVNILYLQQHIFICNTKPNREKQFYAGL